MGLESPINTIADLNIANPADGDLASQGDNHLRLIKDAIKKTFPSITIPVTASGAELNIVDGLLATTADLNKIKALATTAAQFGYLSDVTAPIQFQFAVMFDTFADAIVQANPVGEIKMWGSLTAPTGYLFCHGQDVLKAGIYADLFGVLGTTYGTPVDPLKFRLPDFRGRVPRGHHYGNLLDDSGRLFGSSQADQTGWHVHGGVTSDSGTHRHQIGTTTRDDNTDPGTSQSGYNYGARIRPYYTGERFTSYDGDHSHTITTTTIIGAVIGDETRVKNLSVNFIIRY